MSKVDNLENSWANKHMELGNEIGLEDRVFPIAFAVLKVAGFWTPTTLKFPFYILYEIYKLFCFMSVILLITSMVVDNTISEEKSWRALIENMFLLLTILTGLCKIFNVLIRRPNVIHILEKHTEDRWSILRDDNEISIIEESKSSEKFITRFCLTMVIMNGLSNALNPLLLQDPKHPLMVDGYTPCDLSHVACFWISYLYQVFGYGVTSIVHVACDSLIYNSVDRICAHLRILEHRLLKLPVLVEATGYAEEESLEYEQVYLKECIRDHHSISETILEVNKTFYETVFIQFFSSISVLCTNIYLLSMQEMFSPDFISVFLYLCCALVQNFFYCWYGYKVSANSLHIAGAIFDMNWCILHMKTKKMLMYIMLRTSNTVELFNTAILTLSPESFVNILKISYSTFNILQQTSKK